jgi:hypothetical protein
VTGEGVPAAKTGRRDKSRVKGGNVLLEALQAILGMLIKAREVSRCSSICAVCNGGWRACFDTLFDESAEVQ